MQSMSRDSTGSTPTTGTTDYWLPIKWGTQFTIKECTPYRTHKTSFLPLKIQRFLYSKDGTEKHREIIFNLFVTRGSGSGIDDYWECI